MTIFARRMLPLAALAAGCTASGFASADEALHPWAEVTTVRPAKSDPPLNGVASFYGTGETTASGEPFDKTSLTAAHPTLPFGTRVRVTNLANGRDVVVRINDRGPFVPGRILDLSEAAADALDMRTSGLAPVQLSLIAH